jgi:hypothetical protein
MSRVCHDGPSDERPISVLYHGDPPSTRFLTETETTSRTKKLRKRLHGVRRIGIEDMRRQIAQVEAIVFLDSVPRRSGPIGCCSAASIRCLPSPSCRRGGIGFGVISSLLLSGSICPAIVGAAREAPDACKRSHPRRRTRPLARFAFVKRWPAGCGDAFHAMRRIGHISGNGEIVGLATEHQLVAA